MRSICKFLLNFLKKNVFRLCLNFKWFGFIISFNIIQGQRSSTSSDNSDRSDCSYHSDNSDRSDCSYHTDRSDRVDGSDSDCSSLDLPTP